MGSEKGTALLPAKDLVGELETILSELESIRLRAEDLVSQLSALLDAPAPGLPEYIVSVFAQAKEVFGSEAALFLATPHLLLNSEMPCRVARDAAGARRVQELLSRISFGICV